MSMHAFLGETLCWKMSSLRLRAAIVLGALVAACGFQETALRGSAGCPTCAYVCFCVRIILFCLRADIPVAMLLRLR
jgi:hypothetical protein